MKQKLTILGHANPDVDSIVSGYLLERIFEVIHACDCQAEFVIPDQTLDSETVQVVEKYGIDASKYQKPLESDCAYLLLDHYQDTRITKEPVKIIDHHPTSQFPSIEQAASTALILYRMYHDQYVFSKAEVEKILLATYIDTASLHSTKVTEQDRKDVKQLLEQYQIDEKKLYEEGLLLTDLHQDLETVFLHGLKKYQYADASVWSSYVQIKEEDHDQVSSLLEQCKKTREEQHLDCYVFLEHNMSSFKTTAYFITKDGCFEKQYDQYTSRGSTIMPMVEQIYTSPKQVTAFIGSSSRCHENFEHQADIVSDYLQAKGYRLAFGACSSGVMGKCYQVFRDHKKQILSITVEKFQEDLANLPESDAMLADTTFDRTKQLYQNSDLVVFLPGGTGTISEFFACLEENRTVDYGKEIILYNANHYYDPVLEGIEQCIREGLNGEDIYDYFQVANDMEELIELIEDYEKRYHSEKLKKLANH